MLISQRRVLAALRDAVFFSLADLEAAIRAIVAEVNTEPFQKREGTRRELFERYERPAAQGLPEPRYEYAEWRTSLVHRDHHIEVARGYYSVPYALVGQRVDVRLGAHLVEIFQHGAHRICSDRDKRGFARLARALLFSRQRLTRACLFGSTRWGADGATGSAHAMAAPQRRAGEEQVHGRWPHPSACVTLLRTLEHSADYADGSRKLGVSQARIMLGRYVRVPA
ncbi:MAG TPA: hypothetical protein VMF89_22085 [Polyangiales bacterium]|nr:hypothetical protein [Polyangiales bacterium]